LNPGHSENESVLTAVWGHGMGLKRLMTWLDVQREDYVTINQQRVEMHQHLAIEWSDVPSRDGHIKPRRTEVSLVGIKLYTVCSWIPSYNDAVSTAEVKQRRIIYGSDHKCTWKDMVVDYFKELFRHL